ncbi:hypothetical protein GCM10023075_72900 [Streptosporangium album]
MGSGCVMIAFLSAMVVPEICGPVSREAVSELRDILLAPDRHVVPELINKRCCFSPAEPMAGSPGRA